MTHAGKNVGCVALNFHTPAAAIALLAAPEFTVEKHLFHLQTRRHAREKGNQSFAVRLSSRKITQHKCSILPDAVPLEWARMKEGASLGIFHRHRKMNDCYNKEAAWFLP
jgi:hypothetical protein